MVFICLFKFVTPYFNYICDGLWSYYLSFRVCDFLLLICWCRLIPFIIWPFNVILYVVIYNHFFIFGFEIFIFIMFVVLCTLIICFLAFVTFYFLFYMWHFVVFFYLIFKLFDYLLLFCMCQHMTLFSTH